MFETPKIGEFAKDVNPVPGQKLRRSSRVAQKRKLISAEHVILSDSDDSDDKKKTWNHKKMLSNRRKRQIGYRQCDIRVSL